MGVLPHQNDPTFSAEAPAKSLPGTQLHLPERLALA